MKKKPISEVLVNRGFFANPKEALGWIMSGKVLVNNHPVYTPGQSVDEQSEIKIKGLDREFVSKGGLKLKGAIADFGIAVQDKVALDVGASTGGFTDCLLQHGAVKVYAIDVGYGQLSGVLRNDPRVVNMEKVNISEIDAAQLDPKPQLATLDFSFLSLKKSIPIVVDLLAEQSDLICLVKPLFEIPSAENRRTGIISDRNIYAAILHDLIQFVQEIGFGVAGVTHSHISGNKGTREFFLWVRLEKTDCPINIDAQIDLAIEAVLKLPLYKK